MAITSDRNSDRPANGAGLNLRSFATMGNRAASKPEGELETAEYWLNVGYEQAVEDADGNEEIIFVSLARGIPLDSIKPFEISRTKSSNMAALRDAQNALHASFMDEAKKLEPGEARLLIVDEQLGLAVQIKRVRAEQTAPAENTLRRAVSFARPEAA